MGKENKSNQLITQTKLNDERIFKSPLEIFKYDCNRNERPKLTSHKIKKIKPIVKIKLVLIEKKEKIIFNNKFAI